MYYEISSAESLDNDQTRTVVLFWATRADYLRDRNKTNYLLREDFVCNVQGTGRRIITNAEGHWKLTDGTFVDPETLDPEQQYEFERETFEVDVPAVLLENIERYLDTVRDDGDTNAGRIIRGELRGDRTSRELARREGRGEERADFLREPRVRDIVRAPRESSVRR